MSNSYLQRSRDGSGIGGINAKAVLLRQRSAESHQQHSMEFYSGQEEAPLCPDTPPTTLGSRTTSSSAIKCDFCTESSAQCICYLGHSDTESSRMQGSEVDSIRSSIPYHAYNRSERSDLCAYGRATVSLSPEQSVRGLTPGGTSLLADNTRTPSRLINITALTPPNTELGVDVNHENTDSNESESGEDDEDYDSQDEDVDWSGQDGGVEAIVLESLGDDLALAAYLIPILHKEYFSDFKADVKKKVGGWCQELTNCSAGVDGMDISQTPSSTAQSNELPSSSRKRQRGSGSSRRNKEADEDCNDDDDDDEDDNEDSKDMGGFGGHGSPQPVRRLACPFNKKEPGKYCIQYDNAETPKNNYRACEGPGFKNIQRLKEHIKRKHYPVQCDRCYEVFVFSGADRGVGVRALEAHRQLPEPCERRDSNLKEGISEAQCADLDKKKGPKKGPTKNQLLSNVERYWEIWDILFPGNPRPASPWYDGNSSNGQSVRFPQESRRLCGLFNGMLNHQINDQKIRFAPGHEKESRSRIEGLVKRAFDLFMGLGALPSSTNSSSTRSFQRNSLLSGPYENLSDPRAMDRWSSSTPSSSSMRRSHNFIDTQSSPPGNGMLVNSRHPGAVPNPNQFLHNANLQNFGSPLHGAQPQPVPSGFPLGQVAFHNTIPFPATPFNNNGFNAGNPYMYFTNPNPNFNGDNASNGYAAPPTQEMDDWDQVSGPKRTDYNASQ